MVSTKVFSSHTNPWDCWDITPLARFWIDNPEKNCGMLLNTSGDSGLVQFFSCKALKFEIEEHGGTRVACRPILVIQ